MFFLTDIELTVFFFGVYGKLNLGRERFLSIIFTIFPYIYM